MPDHGASEVTSTFSSHLFPPGATLATPSSSSNQAHPFASDVLEPASVQPLLLVPGQVSRTVALALLAATLFPLPLTLAPKTQ